MSQPASRQAIWKRQAVGIGLALLVAVAALGGWFAWQRSGEADLETEASLEPQEADSESAAVEETWTAELYFPSVSGLLYGESHEVAESTLLPERIATVVTQLLAGPRGTGLRPPLPADVSVRKVYVTAGTAYLDLESEAAATPPASGSAREMLTIYSLVNSVLLNFEEVERLVLLWNGGQMRTFAGHMDTRRPLVANLDLIARGP